MPPITKCLNCDARYLEAIGPCKKCGGIIERLIMLEGNAAYMPTSAVGTVVQNFAEESGLNFQVVTPKGEQSNTSLKANVLAGELKPHIDPLKPHKYRIDAGRDGEKRVVSCIVNYFEKKGCEPVTLDAKDSLGEDGVICISGSRIIVQVVSFTLNPTFFENVKKSGKEFTKFSNNLESIAELIHSTIEQKHNVYKDRIPNVDVQSMILAIDANHFGVLCNSDFAGKYLEIFGDPVKFFEFGAVWLVGPTDKYIIKLGGSKW